MGLLGGIGGGVPRGETLRLPGLTDEGEITDGFALSESTALLPLVGTSLCCPVPSSSLLGVFPSGLNTFFPTGLVS